MTHTYNITGMTCGSCVNKVKSAFLKLGDVTSADVQLTTPQATISMQKHIPVMVLQDAISKAGNYAITEADAVMHNMNNDEEKNSWFKTYKPILLIGAYITGLTLLLQLSALSFSWELWMSNFMAAFFIVFSFFKILDVRGFADSYSTYDIIAKSWRGWGFIYPFIELVLGIAFLVHFQPLITNGVTLVVMSISIIGVLLSVLNNKKIKCACLGAFFNLPMSSITIIEDALMIAMSAGMLMLMIN